MNSTFHQQPLPHHTKTTAAKPNPTTLLRYLFHFFHAFFNVSIVIKPFLSFIVNVFCSCSFTNFCCFSLVSLTMEAAKLLQASTIYTPPTPSSSFHQKTGGSCFSFNPISYFPQKFNLSVKAQAASIG